MGLERDVLRQRCSPAMFVRMAVPIVAVFGSGCDGGVTEGSLTPLRPAPEAPAATVSDPMDFVAEPSPDGRHILFTSRRSGVDRLYLMDPDGSNQRLISGGPGQQWQGTWSPDSRRIVYKQRNPENHWLAVMNVDGSDPTMLIENPSFSVAGAWSPDGTRILFGWDRNGSEDIWSVSPEGGEPEFVLGSDDSMEINPSWSPDGRRILFQSNRDGSVDLDRFINRDMDIYSADPTGGPWAQLTAEEGTGPPKWSPDGTKILFFARRAGQFGIYTMNVDGSGQTLLTEHPFQWDPSWSHDGSHIYFNSPRDGRRGVYVMTTAGLNVRKLSNNTPSSFVSVLRDSGVDDAVDLWWSVRTTNPESVYFLEREVRYLADNFFEMGLLRQATRLYEVNTEAYPASETAHLGLARAHLAAGHTEAALKSYGRVIELDAARPVRGRNYAPVTSLLEQFANG